MSYALKQLDSLIEIRNSAHLHKYTEDKKCWILDSKWSYYVKSCFVILDRLLILGFKPFLADI